jgi:hypothetical protein
VPFPTTGPQYCNLGPTFDFNGGSSGDQDGLLVTGSTALKNCYADWTALLGNTVNNGKIFDLTGNLREITKQATNTYPAMGGAFDTQDESGATCSFNFYTTDQNFRLYDLGFRCCFAQDPTVYTCGDGAKDGTESDIDCGGAACPTCGTGKTCSAGTDCTSGVCLATKKCQ